MLKIAVVGSRTIEKIDLGHILPAKCSEIISGGARGVDSCASNFAKENNIELKIFLPEYSIYGKSAPILRNRRIVDYADKVIIIWDGNSKGTKSVIDYCIKKHKDHEIILINNNFVNNT